MRERLLGDPGFPVKLSIEVGIGITMKLLAEVSKRGDNFTSELDFVFANVVMAIIADTMLVWLPAPRAALSSKTSVANQSAIGKWLKSCPDNAFQVNTRPALPCPALPRPALSQNQITHAPPILLHRSRWSLVPVWSCLMFCICCVIVASMYWQLCSLAGVLCQTGSDVQLSIYSSFVWLTTQCQPE